MVLLTMEGMSGRWDRQLPPESFCRKLGSPPHEDVFILAHHQKSK